MGWLDKIASQLFFLKCFGFSWLVVKLLQATSKLGHVAKYLITFKPNLKWNKFNYASAISIYVTIFLMESYTLVNVQKKGSNTISPHCFVTWCSIQIIIKVTHICKCVINQHNLNFIWVEKNNNWYYMNMISSGFISICWHKCISILIIIRYIRSGCVYLRSINKI